MRPERNLPRVSMASVSWGLPWHCATLALIQDHEDRIFPWRDEEEPPSGLSFPFRALSYSAGHMT